MRFKYDHGLPFSQRLGITLDQQITRVQSRKSSLIIIDGPLGSGKTTLGVEVADHISGYDITLKRDDCPQYAMGGIQFQEKLGICFDQRLKCLIYDEAGDFSKHGALTTFNRSLIRTFETFRAFNIVVILILPTIDSLGYSLFNLQVPRLLIHCHNRTNNQGNFKVFSLMRMYKLKALFPKIDVKPTAYNLVTPNYNGHFLDLEPERSKQLDNMTTLGKRDISVQSTVKNLNLVSINEIANILGKSIGYTRLLIYRKKLKPERKFGRNTYYSKSIIDTLANSD